MTFYPSCYSSLDNNFNSPSSSKQAGGKPLNVNGVHHRPTPPVHSLPNQFHQVKVSPKTEAISEEEEIEDLEVSAAIQASNVRAFLSSDSESGQGSKWYC